MARLVLIHWRTPEGEERIKELNNLGHQASLIVPVGGGGALRPLRAAPPEVILIDLTRLPAQGREVAIALRNYQDTRHVPLLFAGGTREKVAVTRELLPDAVFSPWEEIAGGITRALTYQPLAIAPPPRHYQPVALPQKLGIKPGVRVASLYEPKSFAEALGPLPESVQFCPLKEKPSLVLLFITTLAQFEARLPKVLAALPEATKLWLVWPKKSSPLARDLTQAVVRERAFAVGLVDFKVCAVDEHWTALCFVRRKTAKGVTAQQEKPPLAAS